MSKRKSEKATKKTTKKSAKEVTVKPPLLDNATLTSMYRQMVVIREFEEQAMDLYSRALIPGIIHVSIGQEAVAAGVGRALRVDDYIIITHRGHGQSLAKGAQPRHMFAELLGKVEGYCRGKGGSMHVADPSTGNLGANGIIGGILPIATGAALSAKTRETDQVSVCIFGDGAANQGLLLESFNMAAIWKLPVIFICENNQYGEYTPSGDVTAGEIYQRGEPFGIPSSKVDGMDVLAVYEAVSKCVERAREGSGPSFLVCQTYRYHGHGSSDRERAYRTREEEEMWRGRDPIERLGNVLLSNGETTSSDLESIAQEVKAEMLEAVEFAKEAPFPPPEEVSQHVYPA